MSDLEVGALVGFIITMVVLVISLQAYVLVPVTAIKRVLL